MLQQYPSKLARLCYSTQMLVIFFILKMFKNLVSFEQNMQCDHKKMISFYLKSFELYNTAAIQPNQKPPNLKFLWKLCLWQNFYNVSKVVQVLVEVLGETILKQFSLALILWHSCGNSTMNTHTHTHHQSVTLTEQFKT